MNLPLDPGTSVGNDISFLEKSSLKFYELRINMVLLLSLTCNHLLKHFGWNKCHKTLGFSFLKFKILFMSVKMSQDNDTLYFTHFNVDVGCTFLSEWKKKFSIENIEKIWEISRYNFSDGLKFTSLHQTY